ncbi:MAG: insulinase family protein [Salinivirgaceae bacterium]|nr:insulinase family protein [Salinivirgaceae bacterium]
MIKYDKFTLDNGLRVIVHKDETTPIVAFNLLYDVGARDENPEKTGFAHLFEHLMFEGSKNIPSYDAPLQQAGGENNAFTNNNITNYYITIPKENLELAFWLESDRMLELALTQEKLDIQKKVVVEEFKQRYLNQPYGDWNLLLRPLAYEKHPYQWPTIGKETAHIETTTLDEVKDFFYKFYAPNNAILVVAGNVAFEEIKKLSEKWFGNIPRRNTPKRNLPLEPKQEKAKLLEVDRPIPVDTIYQAYHMCDRLSPNYYATDLISDILSNGKSSRLNQYLVMEKKIFSQIDAYITGDHDPGLFIITGNLSKGVSFELAQKEIRNELDQFITDSVDIQELTKVQNKVEANLIYSEISILTKAMDLAHFELLDDANRINSETENYLKVTPEQLKNVASELFRVENCSTLLYHSKQ